MAWPLLLTTCHEYVSPSAPGSEPVPVRWTGVPSTTVWSAGPVTVGGRLLTTRPNVALAIPPSLSVAVMVTVCDWTGPLVVANDQLQVPFAFFVTVPTDAVSPTVS